MTSLIDPRGLETCISSQKGSVRELEHGGKESQTSIAIGSDCWLRED